MYYDIVESGRRIRKLRTAANMTRQTLAEEVGVSLDALRKIETGVNGAKIDTLIAVAEVFHISLDYLVCGCRQEPGLDGLLAGLSDVEIQFVRSLVKGAVENLVLLRQ